MKSSAQKGTAASIVRLMEFGRLGARLDMPSFSKFLGLSAAETDETPTILCPERMSFRNNNNNSSNPQQPSLVFSYKFPDRCQHLPTTLSTYTSILDDATTMALVAATKSNPRPGVSVTMQCQWCTSTSPQYKSPKEVDIWTTITKQGRTLGFVRADVRDPSNNDALICSFDHVKYLPASWFFGWMLSPIGMWCLNLFFKYLGPYVLKPKPPPQQDYAKIMDSYEQTSATTATFEFGPQHSNGMGGLHGGVQAILMEKLGKAVAQHELGCDQVACERLSVSYQSSASKQLELKAHVMVPPTSDRLTLRIEIVRKPKSTSGSKKVVVVSEGILTFGITSSKKDQ